MVGLFIERLGRLVRILAWRVFGNIIVTFSVGWFFVKVWCKGELLMDSGMILW